MSQNDFNLANQGFPSMREDMNSALQALATNSSGPSEPSTTYAYQWWYDETNDILKMRNSANDAWIDFATFDQTTESWSFPTLTVDGDLTVDTDTLYVDSANNRVGIGTSSPSEALEIDGDVKATGDVETISINGGPLAGFRNAIINGNFAVNQRGASGTVTLSAGDYGHDRWKAGSSGCTYTFATTENVTTITITSGSLVQVIEGENLLTDTYTLSFTGTALGKIGAGSFGVSGITGSVTGGANLEIEFNTGTVAQVQLEPGPVATPFECRPVGTELTLCQRYFETGAYSETSGVASVDHVGSYRTYCSFKVTKRATPSITGTNDQGTFQALNITLDSAQIGRSNNVANRENSGTFAADAEL